MSGNSPRRKLDVHVRLKDGSKGPLLSTGYVRVVVGGRGDYLEIHPDQIIRAEIEPEPSQEYRLSGKWREKAFYGWYRTIVSHRKVYEQFRHVGYADYIPGYFYVDPAELVFEGELYREKSKYVAKRDDLPQIDFEEN